MIHLVRPLSDVMSNACNRPTRDTPGSERSTVRRPQSNDPANGRRQPGRDTRVSSATGSNKRIADLRIVRCSSRQSTHCCRWASSGERQVIRNSGPRFLQCNSWRSAPSGPYWRSPTRRKTTPSRLIIARTILKRATVLPLSSNESRCRGRHKDSRGPKLRPYCASSSTLENQWNSYQAFIGSG